MNFPKKATYKNGGVAQSMTSHGYAHPDWFGRTMTDRQPQGPTMLQEQLLLVELRPPFHADFDSFRDLPTPNSRVDSPPHQCGDVPPYLATCA